jgi:hypothetical protein
VENCTDSERELMLLGYMMGLQAGLNAKETKEELGVDLADQTDAFIAGWHMINNFAAKFYKIFRPKYDTFLKAINESEAGDAYEC